MAVAQHLPRGRHQAGDRHLKFHEDRDNLGFRKVKVSADGKGVVSHAGVGLLREMAEQTGRVDAVSGALIDTYAGVPVHAPGRVFTDLAVAIADGTCAHVRTPCLTSEDPPVHRRTDAAGPAGRSATRRGAAAAGGMK